MNYAIIVAGGVGKRMMTNIPKQFLEISGKPILYYTVKRFLDFLPDLQIVLVLPSNSDLLDSFKETHFPEINNIKIVEGGETRFHSVFNGLNSIQDEGIVFIHDGVRPFVSNSVLSNCLKTAIEFGNAIPALDLKDSLRKITNSSNKSVLRTEYKAIQTPQTFTISAIKKAFELPFSPEFTDEASVYEKNGGTIHLVEGNDENIKITTPLDFQIAQILLNPNYAIGFDKGKD